MVIPSIILYCTKVCLKLSNLTAGFGVKGRGRRDGGLKESKFKRMKVLYCITFVFFKKNIAISKTEIRECVEKILILHESA